MLISTMRLGVLLLVCVVLSACDQNRPEWVDIQAIPDGNYRMAIRTYQDTDSVAQPFKLGVRSRSVGETVQVLSAEQCKNVEVFQDKRSITVFYDTLILDHFSGDGLGPEVPRISLCDNSVAACRDKRREYMRDGIRGVPVCTLR